MAKVFSVTDFLRLFPTNESCLEEVKRLRYPKGILCPDCKKITRYYKIASRLAYSCEHCRHQVYPLVGTIFERTTTSLRIWFLAIFLMTQTRSTISIRQLQKELDVTYKTAWRIYKQLHYLMEMNNGDLLAKSEEVIKWTLFNTFEFKVVQKQDSSH